MHQVARKARRPDPPSNGDQIDPALLAGLSWRSLGPARGGRSQAVAGSSSRPLEYYFGATGGGLWKTADGGVTWRAVSDKFFKSSRRWRSRGLAIKSRRRLRRDGRNGAARQHHSRRWCLQINRRRQNLHTRWPREDTGHRTHSDPSNESRYRLRCGARRSLWCHA
jgi:hypothetical protein